MTSIPWWIQIPAQVLPVLLTLAVLLAIFRYRDNRRDKGDHDR